jgi:hypothetical protein
MGNDSDIYDLIVDAIDTGAIRPKSHSICRYFCRHFQIDRIDDRALLEAFDAGNDEMAKQFSTPLWHRIRDLPVNAQGKERILVGLTLADKDVDFYHAEFLVGWALEIGIGKSAIRAAFGCE